MRGVGLGDDQQPGRVLVEPVDDARPPDPADARQARAAMADQRVDERARRMARRRMDDEPRRLVDDDQMLVLEDDVERHVLAGERRILRRRRLEGDPRALGEPASRDRGRRAVDAALRRPRSAPSAGCATGRSAARRRRGRGNGRAARPRRPPTSKSCGPKGRSRAARAGSGGVTGSGSRAALQARRLALAFTPARAARALGRLGGGRRDQRPERGDDRLDVGRGPALWASSARRIAATCAGLLPQQPPTIRAPQSTARPA